LSESLDFTVSKVVNEVGVNINTASPSILRYVSGLTKATISKLVSAKPFKNRKEIENLKGISSKVYEQCIGFLRIKNGENILDNTGIHPESYEITNKLLQTLNLSLTNLNTQEFKQTLENVNIEKISKELDTDTYTLTDIIKELLHPGLDIRENLNAPLLKSDILTIDDLKIGMQLEGTVRNVTSFGAFVDIGLHDDGLVHISKMSKSFIKDPSEVVSTGEIVKVYVCDINKEKQKVSLSLIPLA